MPVAMIRLLILTLSRKNTGSAAIVHEISWNSYLQNAIGDSLPWQKQNHIGLHG